MPCCGLPNRASRRFATVGIDRPDTHPKSSRLSWSLGGLHTVQARTKRRAPAAARRHGKVLDPPIGKRKSNRTIPLPLRTVGTGPVPESPFLHEPQPAHPHQRTLGRRYRCPARSGCHGLGRGRTHPLCRARRRRLRTDPGGRTGGRCPGWDHPSGLGRGPHPPDLFRRRGTCRPRY